jgi:hypothetical protein
MANSPDNFLSVTGEVQGTAHAPIDMLEAMRAFVKAFVSAMKQEAPINKDPAAKTRGGLRTSIEGNVRGGRGEDAIMSFMALSYVNYILDGTNPHPINPVSKRALSFQWHTGTARLHGAGGRGPRGGLLRSTSFKQLPYKYVTIGGSMGRAAGAKSVRMGGPRFGGRELLPATYNQRGRMIKGPTLGHIQPVNVKANLAKGSAYAGNILLHKVNHPGSQPNDFITRALLLVQPEYDTMADMLGEAWAGDLATVFQEAMPR